MSVYAKKQTGFTIVELLIVIVVIGILAAITIVAYNGVQRRANIAVAQSELKNATKSLEIKNAENGTYPVDLSSLNLKSSSKVSYQYSYSSADNTFCLTGTVANISYFTSANDKTPKAGACAGDAQDGTTPTSCWNILSTGYSTGSGLYRIKPAGSADFFYVYCDMTTSGGGWTLILTNPGPYSVWNSTNVRSVNVSNPSLSAQYSILDKADSIKANLNGKLQYRLDGVALGRWGGVWETPYTNTFTGTSAVENATNIEKYDTWTIDTTLTDGTSALSNVMPYTAGSYLLTTWGGTGNWYGTIVTSNSGWSPAPYISPSQTNPGTIWYWVK